MHESGWNKPPHSKTKQNKNEVHTSRNILFLQPKHSLNIKISFIHAETLQSRLVQAHASE